MAQRILRALSPFRRKSFPAGQKEASDGDSHRERNQRNGGEEQHTLLLSRLREEHEQKFEAQRLKDEEGRRVQLFAGLPKHSVKGDSGDRQVVHTKENGVENESLAHCNGNGTAHYENSYAKEQQGNVSPLSPLTNIPSSNSSPSLAEHKLSDPPSPLSDHVSNKTRALDSAPSPLSGSPLLPNLSDLSQSITPKNESPEQSLTAPSVAVKKDVGERSDSSPAVSILKPEASESPKDDDSPFRLTTSPIYMPPEPKVKQHVPPLKSSDAQEDEIPWAKDSVRRSLMMIEDASTYNLPRLNLRKSEGGELAVSASPRVSLFSSPGVSPRHPSGSRSPRHAAPTKAVKGVKTPQNGYPTKTRAPGSFSAPPLIRRDGLGGKNKPESGPLQSFMRSTASSLVKTAGGKEGGVRNRAQSSPRKRFVQPVEAKVQNTTDPFAGDQLLDASTPPDTFSRTRARAPTGDLGFGRKGRAPPSESKSLQGGRMGARQGRLHRSASFPVNGEHPPEMAELAALKAQLAASLRSTPPKRRPPPGGGESATVNEPPAAEKRPKSPLKGAFSPPLKSPSTARTVTPPRRPTSPLKKSAPPSPKAKREPSTPPQVPRGKPPTPPSRSKPALEVEVPSRGGNSLLNSPGRSVSSLSSASSPSRSPSRAWHSSLMAPTAASLGKMGSLSPTTSLSHSQSFEEILRAPDRTASLPSKLRPWSPPRAGARARVQSPTKSERSGSPNRTKTKPAVPTRRSLNVKPEKATAKAEQKAEKPIKADAKAEVTKEASGVPEKESPVEASRHESLLSSSPAETPENDPEPLSELPTKDGELLGIEETDSKVVEEPKALLQEKTDVSTEKVGYGPAVVCENKEMPSAEAEMETSVSRALVTDASLSDPSEEAIGSKEDGPSISEEGATKSAIPEAEVPSLEKAELQPEQEADPAFAKSEDSTVSTTSDDSLLSANSEETSLSPKSEETLLSTKSEGDLWSAKSEDSWGEKERRRMEIANLLAAVKEPDEIEFIVRLVKKARRDKGASILKLLKADDDPPSVTSSIESLGPVVDKGGEVSGWETLLGTAPSDEDLTDAEASEEVHVPSCSAEENDSIAGEELSMGPETMEGLSNGLESTSCNQAKDFEGPEESAGLKIRADSNEGSPEVNIWDTNASPTSTLDFSDDKDGSLPISKAANCISHGLPSLDLRDPATYIETVLAKAGLTLPEPHSLPAWFSQTEVLNPALFAELERHVDADLVPWKAAARPRARARAPRKEGHNDRRLLFDCMEESLQTLLAPHKGSPLMGRRRWLRPLRKLPRGADLVAEIVATCQLKRASSFRGGGEAASPQGVEELLQRCLPQAQRKWDSFETEELEVGTEMEVGILDDLIGEAVQSFMAVGKGKRRVHPVS